MLLLCWALAEAAAALAPADADDAKAAALVVAVPVEGGAGTGPTLGAGAARGTTSALTAAVDALGSGATEAFGERQSAGRSASIRGPS